MTTRNLKRETDGDKDIHIYIYTRIIQIWAEFLRGKKKGYKTYFISQNCEGYDETIDKEQ